MSLPDPGYEFVSQVRDLPEAWPIRGVGGAAPAVPEVRAIDQALRCPICGDFFQTGLERLKDRDVSLYMYSIYIIADCRYRVNVCKLFAKACLFLLEFLSM